MANAAKVVAAAKAEHDKPIPKELLTSFPVPDVKSISFIPVQSVQQPGTGRQKDAPAPNATELAKKINADGEELPFFVQFDHVKVRGSRHKSIRDNLSNVVGLRICARTVFSRPATRPTSAVSNICSARLACLILDQAHINLPGVFFLITHEASEWRSALSRRGGRQVGR